MSPIGFAILSGAGVVRKATRDNATNIFVHTVFKAPIEASGRVRIDLETAGDSNHVVISPDAPIFGTVLDDADAGIEFCTIQEDEETIKLLTHCGEDPAGQASAPFSEGNGNCGTVKDNCKHEYCISEAADLVLEFGDVIGGKYAGRTMMVDCYTVHRSGAMEMLVDAEHFGGNFYVEASTLFRDQATGEDLAAEFIIPNAKIQSNFTFAMSSSGDPSTFDFVMDAFPAYTKFDKTHKCLCALQIIGGDQDASAEQATECDPITIESGTEIEDVLAGYASVWPASVTATDPETKETTTIIADTQAEFARFGRNLSAAVNGLSVDFYGTLISGYNPSYVPAEDQTGYYMPIAIKSGATLSVLDEYGAERALAAAASSASGYSLFILPVDPSSLVASIVATGSNNKKSYYSFDFNNVNFA